MVRSLPALLGISLFTLACDSQSPDPSAGGPGTSAGEIPLVVIDPEAGFHTLLDETGITEATIDADVLTLDLEFGGGCEEHDFQAITSGSFLESLPVQLRIFLRHDAHEDPCDGLLHERVKFDLTPVAELYRRTYPTEPGPIVLRITTTADHETVLTYVLDRATLDS